MKITFVGTMMKPTMEIIQNVEKRDDFNNVEHLLTLLNYPEAHIKFISVIYNGKKLHPLDSVPLEGELFITIPVGGG
jgi:hypothetical protein